MPDPNTQQGRKSIEELIKGAPTPITPPMTPLNATTSTTSLSMDFSNPIHTGDPSSTSISDSENAGHFEGQSSIHRAVTSVREASHNSTLGRPTLGSTPKLAAVGDVENQLDYDLENYKNTGIDADNFLRNVLMLDEDEYEKLKEKTDAATTKVTKSGSYKKQLESFKKVTTVNSSGKSTSREASMYKPFVKMGNMMLEELEKTDSNEAKQVRLCCNSDRQVELGRKNRPAIKPDIFLVPKCVAENVRRKSKGFHIREVLSPFEFKLKKNSRNVIGHSQEASHITIPTSASQAVDEDVFQTMSVISANKSAVSTGTAGKKRKAIQDATDEPNKLARGEEGGTAGSASRSSKIVDSDPHGCRQLARYAAAALSDRGDRNFVCGVLVNAREMTFVFYHRTGIIEADAFDFCEHPEYLALFLYMFQHDPSTYGFNTTTGYHDPFDIYNKDSATIKMDIKDKLVEKNEEYMQNGVYDDLETTDEEAAEYCVVGRGGSVYKAVSPDHKDVPDMAVKFSWQSTNRKHEIENMKIAGDCIPKNVAETYGYATIEDDTPFEALRNACSRPQKNYTKKTFRVLMMKHYRRLSEVDDMEMFWELIRQLIFCLHELYVKQKLLHRDISIGNLAYEMVDNKPVIIILDFELATVVGDKVCTNEVRFGTAPFMAREVLKGFKSGYRHTLNHDLESVYYIAHFHASGYRGYELPKVKGKSFDPLNRWWSGSYLQMCQAKEEHMSQPPATRTKVLKMLMKHAQSIEILNCARSQFRKRENAVENLTEAYNEMDEEKIEETRLQAFKDGLSGDERINLVLEKREQLALENELRRPPLAISFKEWLENKELFLLGRKANCECDSCCDGLTGSHNSAGDLQRASRYPVSSNFSDIHVPS